MAGEKFIETSAGQPIPASMTEYLRHVIDEHRASNPSEPLRIVILDTDHSEPMLPEVFASEEFVETMADQDFKIILGLEWNPEKVENITDFLTDPEILDEVLATTTKAFPEEFASLTESELSEMRADVSDYFVQNAIDLMYNTHIPAQEARREAAAGNSISVPTQAGIPVVGYDDHVSGTLRYAVPPEIRDIIFSQAFEGADRNCNKLIDKDNFHIIRQNIIEHYQQHDMPIAEASAKADVHLNAMTAAIETFIEEREDPENNQNFVDNLENDRIEHGAGVSIMVIGSAHASAIREAAPDAIFITSLESRNVTWELREDHLGDAVFIHDEQTLTITPENKEAFLHAINARGQRMEHMTPMEFALNLTPEELGQCLAAAELTTSPTTGLSSDPSIIHDETDAFQSGLPAEVNTANRNTDQTPPK